MKALFLSFSFLISHFILAQSQYEKNYAYINTKGEIVFKISAKSASTFENGRAEISKYTIEGSNAYYRDGFINTKGEIVIPCIYDRTKDFKTTATFVRKPNQKLYTLIDQNGKELSSKQFNKPGYFFEGLASFKENDKMGFVDSTGKVVIEPKYLGASYFSEGLVCVMPYDQETEKYGFIDKTGKVVIPFQYRQAGFTSFNNGMAKVKINGKAAYINPKGEVIIQTNFSTVSGFSEGLMMVAQGKSYNGFGYADMEGNFVIKGPFYSAKSFKGGVAVVTKERGKSGLIDKSGNVIIPLENGTVYNNIQESNYIATRNGNEWKYFTIEGKPFTEVDVDWLGDANGTNLIPFKDPKTGNFGYLNTNGELAIPAIFKKAKEFSEGLASVELLDNQSYATGEIIKETPVGQNTNR